MILGPFLSALHGIQVSSKFRRTAQLSLARPS
jgi:hypothetical protein